MTRESNYCGKLLSEELGKRKTIKHTFFYDIYLK